MILIKTFAFQIITEFLKILLKIENKYQMLNKFEEVTQLEIEYNSLCSNRIIVFQQIFD